MTVRVQNKKKQGRAKANPDSPWEGQDRAILEREALRLRMEGKTFAEIAEEMGYSNKGSAHKLIFNALRRDIGEDGRQIRLEDLNRLEVLMKALWPFATGDLELALQYAKENGKKVPIKCNDIPAEDDENHVHVIEAGGAHICYVMPSDAMLKAQAQALKILERRSKYLGLDHSDAINERVTEIMKENSRALGEYVRGILQAPELALSPEQKETAKVLMMRSMQDAQEDESQSA